MKSFNINKYTSIILYGAAAIGKIMYEKFTKNNYHIVGFCDKRADEIGTYMGLPVWSIEKIPYNTQDVVIIFSVKNVFEHENIAIALSKKGYINLLYKPYTSLIGQPDEECSLLSMYYDSILEEEGNKWSFFNIPCSPVKRKLLKKDYGIISQTEKEIIAYIPTEYIFTNNYTQDMKKWGNINLMAFFTHIHFFKFQMGDSRSNVDDYLEEYCVYTAGLENDINITKRWKENVIDNRSMIFEQMNLAYETDKDFFIRNAPTAEWNEKGYFNLTSGKHRATFLMAKGCHYIPVRVNKNDYKIFINDSVADNLLQILETGKFEKKIIIPHPYFYRHPLQSGGYGYIFLQKIILFFARKVYYEKGTAKFEDMNILDVNGLEGYIGRILALMGSKVYRAYNVSDYKLRLILDKLLNVTVKEVELCSFIKEEFDIIFFNIDNNEILLEQILNIKSHFWVITSKNNIKNEITPDMLPIYSFDITYIRERLYTTIYEMRI